jgi:GDP-mannose 6-dehydrogenase
LKISVFGLGYVGAVTLACLARDGHDVIGVDIDAGKLDMIRKGRSPIVEVGVQELLGSGVARGKITATPDAQEAIAQSDLSFVSVGTPGNGNGSQDLRALLRVVENIGTALRAQRRYHVVVVRSTVQPGTVENQVLPRLEQMSGKRAGPDFGLCFQPEFLREGSAIRDYDHPPYTVVGTHSEAAAATLWEIFGHLPCEFLVTRIGTAECLKYACNAFHALKITFANEIGRIAQACEVDPHEVMRLLGLDAQLNISTAYLRPGFAFGGSCLPKDLRALLDVAKRRDVEVPMLASLLPSNRVQIELAVDAVLADGRRAVGMLGLSFKPGTDDLRESPMVALAERFIGKGLTLRIFDPGVGLSRLVGANRRYIEESIPHIGSLMSDDLGEVVGSADIVIVGMADRGLLVEARQYTRPEQLILDLVKMPERAGLRGRYRGICW